MLEEADHPKAKPGASPQTKSILPLGDHPSIGYSLFATYFPQRKKSEHGASHA